MSTIRTTPDIAIAAWVTMFGAEDGIVLVKVDRRKAPGVFVFRDPKGKFDEVSARFPNSEAHRFDAAVRTLKSLGRVKDR